MQKRDPRHTFFIPVMGTGYTMDSPLRVAPFGISSVISLVDDVLMEKIREYYCKLFKEKYVPIPSSEEDCRAKRITAYLNFIHKHALKRFEQIRCADFNHNMDINKYFEMLPSTCRIRNIYLQMKKLGDSTEKKRLQEQLREVMRIGSINVNIMTKLDTMARTPEGTFVANEFSSALAALRGFAHSTLDSAVDSAVVFSAGINQRLYSYVAEFKDFYADSMGHVKKKVILKVNDFRSALTQGKIFAKKGIWVSEYRIESGLNCGGHAFGGQCKLLGPVLEEFRQRRDTLIQNLRDIYRKTCQSKQLPLLDQEPDALIQVQGGIGTNGEDRFLKEHYGVDETGWASPFLLCPEVSSVDDQTLQDLSTAQEEDVVLSETSPMGVPFYTLQSSSAEKAKRRRQQEGNQGLTCSKGYLRLNQEFEKALCPASKSYQKLKIESMKKQGVSEEEFRKVLCNLGEKDCICHQLGNSMMKKYGLSIKGPGEVVVCPGPNLVYFSQIVSLKEMIDHIYGKADLLKGVERPHMFLKELQINILYLKDLLIKAQADELSSRDQQNLLACFQNIEEGIDYYLNLFKEDPIRSFHDEKYLEKQWEQFQQIKSRLDQLKSVRLSCQKSRESEEKFVSPT